MRKEEFHQRLTDGDFTFGDDFWFTCVSFSPKSMSLSRHVKPVKVKLMAWMAYPTPGQSIYFLGFKKNGETDQRQFHTFYRFFAPPAWDHSAEVFLTEAQEAYQRQLIPVKEHVQETWDARLQKLENLKTQLVLEPDKETSL
jgi:hypothetical protein